MDLLQLFDTAEERHSYTRFSTMGGITYFTVIHWWKPTFEHYHPLYYY